MQTKIIEGKTFSGEKRIYTFKLMSAEDGLKLFHDIVPFIADLIPSFKPDNGGEMNINILSLVRELPKILPYERVKELARLLLSGSSVQINNETKIVGDSGIGDYAIGDPMEIYTALFYALVANYPKYLNPLFGAGRGSDTSPANQEQNTQK